MAPTGISASVIPTGSDRGLGLSLSAPLPPEGKGARLGLAFGGPSSAAGAASLPCSARGREEAEWPPKEVRDAVPGERSRGCGGRQQMNSAPKTVLRRGRSSIPLCTAGVSEDGVFTRLFTVYRASGASGVGQACSRAGWANMSATAPDREKLLGWWKDKQANPEPAVIVPLSKPVWSQSGGAQWEGRGRRLQGGLHGRGV